MKNLSYSGIQLKNTIKELLKKSGKTQKELAEYLNLSVATIKKQLNSEDIGFERLIKIANFFDMSVSQLIEVTFIDKFSDTTISYTQQEFVASNPIYTKIIKSLLCGFDYDEIKAYYDLDDKKFISHLKGLEKNDYLVLQGEKDIRLKIRWPLRYDPVSKLTKDRYKKWTESSMKKILSDLEHSQSSLFRYEYFCSEKTAQDLRKEMKDLVERYKKRSEFDVKSLSKSDLKFYSVITAVGNFSGWDLLE